ncbi:hypothetical protein EYC84_009131 [Monilinia fructicola]|uniref:Uncharacterized protein n=1 Tax=Monilinia fructicola TaxID=38448 RepID=A0A5M9JHJ3_MONFR|nr:hypothetical protein EYC84_009131 [Monilinia fructicola]
MLSIAPYPFYSLSLSRSLLSKFIQSSFLPLPLPLSNFNSNSNSTSTSTSTFASTSALFNLSFFRHHCSYSNIGTDLEKVNLILVCSGAIQTSWSGTQVQKIIDKTRFSDLSKDFLQY